MITATISGSFRKFPQVLKNLLEEFKDNKVNVLSPKSSEIVSSYGGFVSLRGDPCNLSHLPDSRIAEGIKTIQNSHFYAIKKSKLLWLMIPFGYLGIMGAGEIGAVIKFNTQMYTLREDWELCREYLLKNGEEAAAERMRYVGRVGSVGEAIFNISKVQLHEARPRGI